MSHAWYELVDEHRRATPALAIFPDRVRENVRRMLARVGDPRRLWSHVKTHKLPPVVALELELGLTHFKCATLAEAEMLARADAPTVLVAYPLVGPNVSRFALLVAHYPATRFLALADDDAALAELSATLAANGLAVEVLLDLDVGQHRTGVDPGSRARNLYRLLAGLPGLIPGGLHGYDGHIKHPDYEVRAREVAAAWEPVDRLRDELLALGLPVPRVIAGGTPTFPFHAGHALRESSPGTCVLWDTSYAGKYAELDFLFAAVLLTRVVSKPTGERVCLDLGYKALASDWPDPRCWLAELPGARMVVHSEEHLVVESPAAERLAVGDVLHAIPYHVCPTVALHERVLAVVDRRVVDTWEVAARTRRLSWESEDGP